jgi:hypothetical protein
MQLTSEPMIQDAQLLAIPANLCASPHNFSDSSEVKAGVPKRFQIGQK